MSRLNFLNLAGLSLPSQIANLQLIKQDDTLFECRLTFQVSPQLYQQISKESLFNLKPELRVSPVDFQDEPEIEIEVTLQPKLLPQLAKHVTNQEAAIDYLIACQLPAITQESDSNSAINPLLLTENWFALKVKQTLESGEIGYRTFWSYLNPASLMPDSIVNGQFPEAMEQFLKDRKEANLAMGEQAISEVLEELANDLKNWDETEFLKQTETAISDFFSEVVHAFEGWVEPNQSSSKIAHSKGKIYQAMLTFFSEEDWEFTKLQGQLILRLAFQGKNGQWNCFALANEDQQRFLFYSVCPLEIPSATRIAINEFLARANYGMTIGNFELDIDSGEIRFKTSLDVTGDRITPALIKQLVYTNVLTTDQYLPGIQAVLNGTMPVDAIRAVEQPEPIG